MTDQVSDWVDCLFLDESTALPHLQSDTVKALGFRLEKRSVQLPNIPSNVQAPGIKSE